MLFLYFLRLFIIFHIVYTFNQIIILILIVSDLIFDNTVLLLNDKTDIIKYYI